MKPQMVSERRKTSRHQAFLQLVAIELSASGIAGSSPSIRGAIRNISSGGLRILLEQTCAASSILKCEIFFDGCPAAIPTLGRARWIQNGGQKSVVGLEFLLH
jgi:hypothetical protein